MNEIIVYKKYYDHLCFCKCGGQIEIKPWHKYNCHGIPKYIHSHYLKGKPSLFEGKHHSKKSIERLVAVRKGKTYEEIFGVEKARIMKENFSKQRRGEYYNLPYSSDWTEDLKECIRKRDGYICQLCGKTQEENGRRLSVHHIDYIKENCDPRNLVTLCISCNVKVNAGRKHWTIFFQLKLRLIAG